MAFWHLQMRIFVIAVHADLENPLPLICLLRIIAKVVIQKNVFESGNWKIKGFSETFESV